VFAALFIQHAMRMRHAFIWDLSGSTLFFTLSNKQNDFRKTVVSTWNVFWFLVKLLTETFIILRRSERDLIKKLTVHWSSCEAILILSDLMIPEFSWQIFEKYSNVKFHADPFGGRRDVPCGGTDGPTERHDEADSRFCQSCERA